MSDPGARHSVHGCSLQRAGKAEVQGVSDTAHIVTSEDHSEMAYLLDKCYRPKSMFKFCISSQDLCSHISRGQRRNIKGTVASLLEPGFHRL